MSEGISSISFTTTEVEEKAPDEGPALESSGASRQLLKKSIAFIAPA